MSSNVLCAEQPLCWTQSKLVTLGIKFCINLNEMVELNYTDNITQISKLITAWSLRNLTTLGKITVVKSTLILKLVHLFSSLTCPNQPTLKNLEQMGLTTFGEIKLIKVPEKNNTR